MVGFDTPEMRDEFLNYWGYMYYIYSIVESDIGTTMCRELLKDSETGYQKLEELNSILLSGEKFQYFNSLDEITLWIKRFLDGKIDDDLTD